MTSRAHGDSRRVAIAEQRVSGCMQRLLKAARVLVERGDEDGRRQVVKGTLQFTANV